MKLINTSKNIGYLFVVDSISDELKLEIRLEKDFVK
jgi:hypothetical protein